jgi:hypothetical protein
LTPAPDRSALGEAASIEEEFGPMVDDFLAWWTSEMARVAREPSDLRPVLEAALLDDVRAALVDLLAAAYREGLGC